MAAEDASKEYMRFRARDKIKSMRLINDYKSSESFVPAGEQCLGRVYLVTLG